LAYLISKMDGVGGLEGWRWMYVLHWFSSLDSGINML
jgi:hypothetical protein